ncbi:hypothetical protein MNL07_03425 [Bartonella krasnovii]|uniref:hypothetical protein n=1 Tax=Bartonella krasnovii TaxID=2267275 RepID=UPI001F4D3161|nr:hypothetical protein [Bartonella krasnovii]UNF40278.1 hypothetical protein MNL09_07535 [Bartonella krasnovii]UNF44541.1 hypothetical protein MNL07_03425 [Bartonella krasnovii]UNF45200.1 hypothetical protein MNL06_06545 [Bartonella krasnovii]
MCDYIRHVGKNSDLPLLIDTESDFIKDDLLRYANSKAMVSSLETALIEIGVVKDHIKLVSNPEKYDAINRGHSLSKHRKGGLPYDEARKAMASHYTRLGNLDKARLTDIEKSIIDVRRENIKAMQKLYEKMQAKAISIDF